MSTNAMAVDPGYVAVMIDVVHVDDHRQTAFRVTAGVDRNGSTRPPEHAWPPASMR